MQGESAPEGGDSEEDHAPSDPLRPVTLAAVVGEQERAADLSDFGGTHDQSGGLGLDLEELLDGGDDRDKVGVVHALQHPRDAEDGEEGLLGGKRLHPSRRPPPQSALELLFGIVGVGSVGVGALLEPGVGLRGQLLRTPPLSHALILSSDLYAKTFSSGGA